MLETYGLLAIALLVVGLGLLVAEVFLPSGGILATATAITLCSALAAAYAAWFNRYPLLWWSFCGVATIAIPSTLGLAFYILPHTSVGRKMLLEAPDLETLEPHAAETRRLESLVGQYGQSLTMLNPGGLVLVNGERVHAFTQGQLLDPGLSVEILEIRGTRVLVRAGSPPQSAALDQAANDPVADFDIPAE